MEDKSKKITFLNYTGEYEEISEDEEDKEDKEEEDDVDNVLFKFKFGDKMKRMSFLEIVPPVYDVPFKTIFSYDKEGMEIAKDFLNSVLFPKTELIEKISSFTSKELPSKFKNFKKNNGSRTVDDAFIAKIKNKNKTIIIDLEMEKNFKYSMTEKFYDYGNGLRRANEFMETWVIALCLDKSRKPLKDKSSKSYILKKYKADEPKILDYLHIYEVYLNDLYNNLDKDIEVFEGEVIKEKGKEWIKLFTIPLWSKYYNSEICYLLPNNLSFEGEYIKKAIQKLADITDLKKLKLETELRDQKDNEEINNRIIEDNYKEGYNRGASEGYEQGTNFGYQYGEAYGYKIGKDEGFKKGQDEGFKRGHDEGFKRGQDEGFKRGATEGYNKGQIDTINYAQEQVQLQLLDFFFKQLLNGQSVENIEIIGKVCYNRIKDRYINYNYQVQKNFFDLLNSKNLIIQ